MAGLSLRKIGSAGTGRWLIRATARSKQSTAATEKHGCLSPLIFKAQSSKEWVESAELGGIGGGSLTGLECRLHSFPENLNQRNEGAVASLAARTGTTDPLALRKEPRLLGGLRAPWSPVFAFSTLYVR